MPMRSYRSIGGESRLRLGMAGGLEEVRRSKAPPFDFAQGRLSRKRREKWGTRRKGWATRRLVHLKVSLEVAGYAVAAVGAENYHRDRSIGNLASVRGRRVSCRDRDASVIRGPRDPGGD